MLKHIKKQKETRFLLVLWVKKNKKNSKTNKQIQKQLVKWCSVKKELLKISQDSQEKELQV